MRKKEESSRFGVALLTCLKPFQGACRQQVESAPFLLLLHGNHSCASSQLPISKGSVIKRKPITGFAI